jgi:hypothetical protein
LHQQAVDKKREADQLKDGKELPVYLKAVTTYAQAYCYYELFGPVNRTMFRCLIALLMHRIRWRSGRG